jgi:hypothetical protein
VAEDEGKDKGRREDDEGAEEEQEEEEKPRRRWPKNRVVGAVIGGLVLLFVIGALVLGGEEKKPAAAAPPPDLTARALVLPESREQRTVVIAPCEGPLEETVRNAAAGNPTSGAATFSVPASNRARQLVIPRCTPGTGTAPGVPAAAFVFTDDSTTGPIRPGSRLLLPAGSEATTIVVSPCTKETTKRDVALSPREDDPDTVVAPAC